MIVCTFGTSLQWIYCFKILGLVHFLAYRILSEVFDIILIKIDSSIEKICHLDSILLFYGVYLILEIKYIGHPDELLRIIGGAYFPLPIGFVEEINFSCIGRKCELVILFGGIHMIQCLFSSVSYHI